MSRMGLGGFLVQPTGLLGLHSFTSTYHGSTTSCVHVTRGLQQGVTSEGTIRETSMGNAAGFLHESEGKSMACMCALMKAERMT